MSQINKSQIIEKFRRHAADTGSSEVQIALLTERINRLTEHMKMHKKDHSSRYGLIKMVNKRRKLLNYLKTHDIEKYNKIIQELNLRG